MPLPPAGSDTLLSLDRAVLSCAPPPPNSADAAPTLSLDTRTTERAACALPTPPQPPLPPPPPAVVPVLLEPPAVKKPALLVPRSVPSADGKKAALAATAGAANDPPKKLAVPRSAAAAVVAPDAGPGGAVVGASCSAMDAGASAGDAAHSRAAKSVRAESGRPEGGAPLCGGAGSALPPSPGRDEPGPGTCCNGGGADQSAMAGLLAGCVTAPLPVPSGPGCIPADRPVVGSGARADSVGGNASAGTGGAATAPPPPPPPNGLPATAAPNQDVSDAGDGADVAMVSEDAAPNGCGG